MWLGTLVFNGLTEALQDTAVLVRILKQNANYHTDNFQNFLQNLPPIFSETFESLFVDNFQITLITFFWNPEWF